MCLVNFTLFCSLLWFCTLSHISSRDVLTMTNMYHPVTTEVTLPLYWSCSLYRIAGEGASPSLLAKPRDTDCYTTGSCYTAAFGCTEKVHMRLKFDLPPTSPPVHPHPPAPSPLWPFSNSEHTAPKKISS